MGSPPDYLRNYPTSVNALDIPPEPEMCWDLSALDPCPDDFTIFGMRFDRVHDIRSIRLSTIKILGVLQFWGIYYTPSQNPSKRMIMQNLWKMLYYMPERHRPKYFAELFDLRRDTGPRLMGWEHWDEDVGPISRLYPDRPVPNAPVHPKWVRPSDAPDHLSDSIIHQFMLPVSEPPEPVRSPRHRKREVEIADPVKSRGSGTKQTERPQGSERRREKQQPPRISDEGVLEAVERTILDYAYHDLQRDPNAPARVPESFATASSMHDLETVQIGTFPAHAYLKLEPTTLLFDNRSTTLYPYRGRGPVWNQYSCSADCVIVLGMLLDIGCTNIDRRSWRYGEITELEKAFIEITNVNWEALDMSTNIKLRDLFLRKLCATVPSIKLGQPGPAWAIWSECTRNFAQFYYRFSVHHQAYHNTSEGVWMSELIEGCIFKPRETKCTHCDTRTIRSDTRIDELPLRLVVSNYVGFRVRINNHTENLNFRYRDSNGKEKFAAYRWLGGIYHKDGHVRVYWTDQERGDNDGENIRMYDDEVNEGVIIGGIPPQHPSDRVPHDWTDIGFLIGIYERVINPSKEMLDAVIFSTNSFKRMAALGRSVLTCHTPWEYVRLPVPEDPTSRTSILPREDHVIPVTTNRFRDVNIHQLPTPVQITSRATSKAGSTPGINQADIEMQDLDSLLNAWPPDNVHEVNSERPPAYYNLFDSVLNSPSRLAEFPEMWPQGLPGDNGAFNFPSLPRADDADNLPFSMPRTPVMDYVHWPSPDNDIFMGGMEWGTHAGAVRRSGRRFRPSAPFARAEKPLRRLLGVTGSDEMPNGPSMTSSRDKTPAEKQNKAPTRKTHQEYTKKAPAQGFAVELPSVRPTKKVPGKKVQDEKKGSGSIKKAARETTVNAGKRGEKSSNDEARTATSKDIGKKNKQKSSTKGKPTRESRKDKKGRDAEECKEARSAHGGPPEPRPYWIPRPDSGELRMWKTAMRNAMSQSPNKRARFADDLEPEPSKRMRP
ncbi:uncharacterized protein N7484_006903 [Penicillium longicatenatum]|uniref:uncharacterized protein n=1 Tax=Penicillium longicatenatum TaxID=1561947 RepID=UPI00254850A5|nr:uncharacterized protein N7484_006903 [Penicillium longicatenatum]KAJ5639041.1 hypothetical protein N7484_006903 [Penicillium longicatenatum]